MNTKKSTFWCFFFALGCLLYLPATEAKNAHDSSCPAKRIDQLAKVRYVHDGDTIVLESGDKVRLIGINTAEIANKHKNQKAQPYANAARDYLKQRLPKNTSIQLQFGRDKKDRYGRILAHTFLPSGENIQAALLKQGLASAIIIPPNDSLARCYLQLEQQARCQKRALWSKDETILASQTLTSSTKGFHLIQGEVSHIETNRYGIWIHLGDDITLGIRPKNQKLFDLTHIQSLTGQTLLARGWVNKGKANRPYMRIKHPLSLQVVGKNTCLTD